MFHVPSSVLSAAISLTFHRAKTALLDEWSDDSRCAFVSPD